MTVGKRHHFLPRMLQKNFADEDGFLYTYDIQNVGKVRREKVANLFVVGHLYSTIEEDGSRNPQMEGEFSKLERDAKLVIDKILSSVRSSKIPYLTAAEREIWDHFFLAQWRRVPEIRELVVGEEGFKAELKRAIDTVEQRGRILTIDERNHYSDSETIKRMKQNAFVDALSRKAPLASAVLASRGLIFARSTNPTKNFILGSVPLVRMSSAGTTDLTHEAVELWLPIANDVAVSPGTYNEAEKVFEVGSKQVRIVNEAIASQSTRIAGRHRETINALRKIVATRQPSY